MLRGCGLRGLDEPARAVRWRGWVRQVVGVSVCARVGAGGCRRARPGGAAALEETLKILSIDEDAGVRSRGAEPAGAAVDATGGAAQPAASQHASRQRRMGKGVRVLRGRNIVSPT